MSADQHAPLNTATTTDETATARQDGAATAPVAVVTSANDVATASAARGASPSTAAGAGYTPPPHSLHLCGCLACADDRVRLDITPLVLDPWDLIGVRWLP